MRFQQRTRLVFLTLLVFSPPAAAQQSVPHGSKVLMLSGGQRNHHSYRRQAYLLQKVLENTRQFEVTVCEDAAILESPSLRKYALIVAMADRRDPEFRLTENQQRALLNFVQEGKGLFSLHGFCCAEPAWVPEMRELLGGVLAHFGKPDTRVKFGHFPVKITDTAHPITHGVANFEHDDELYYHLQTKGEIQPLVCAVHEGKEWPILWTRTYGKGKVCVSVFGHCSFKASARDPLEHEPFQKLVVQSIAWVAGRTIPEMKNTEK